MSGHTPGPWVVTVDDISCLDYANPSAVKEGFIRHGIAQPDGGFTLAVVVDDVIDGEANARLIAASPTLFDFVAKKAAEGDADAARIISLI